MTNTGRQTRQKLKEPLQRAQWLYLYIFTIYLLLYVSLLLYVCQVFNLMVILTTSWAITHAAVPSTQCKKAGMQALAHSSITREGARTLHQTRRSIFTLRCQIEQCLPHSWYPQCDRSMFFTCPKLTDDSPSLIQGLPEVCLAV
jgi:hypothetical protein